MWICFNTVSLMHGTIFNRWTWWDLFTCANYFVCLSINVEGFWYSVSMIGYIGSSPIWLMLIFIWLWYHIDFSNLECLSIYELSKTVLFMYTCVLYLYHLQFCTHVCFNDNSLFWKVGYFFFSLIFIEDKMWVRSPTVYLFFASE